MSAEQVSLPWIMMERKGCLCYSTKVIEYLPNICLIESCLEYLFTVQYSWIPCGTHWVSAVVVVLVLVVIIVYEVVVAVVVPVI